MTRFFFDLQLWSHAHTSHYVIDGECEGDTIQHANAVMQTLANTIIDANPQMKFSSPTWVLRPWLEVVKAHA